MICLQLFEVFRICSVIVPSEVHHLRNAATFLKEHRSPVFPGLYLGPLQHTHCSLQTAVTVLFVKSFAILTAGAKA